MDKVRRVFFHELGHFVAQEINRRYYDGRGVKEIVIHPCERNFNELCGYTKPNVPKGYNDKVVKAPPIYRLPLKLASLTYGCMFQAYLTGGALLECYREHGESDMNSWANYISANRFGYTIKADLGKIEAQYYNSLVTGKLLEDFRELNPSDYLSSPKPNNYDVDVEKLRRHTHQMLIAHRKDYRKLIGSYRVVIRNNTRNYWLKVVWQRLCSLCEMLVR